MPALEQITGALISLLIGTLLGSEVTRWLYRPRVFVRFEEINPLYTGDGVHWSVRVANLGRTVATDCKGIIAIDGLDRTDLLEVHEAYAKEDLPEYPEEAADLSFPRDQIVNPQYFRPIDGECVAWARLGNPSSISINPGITETLDIFKVQNLEEGGYISLPTEFGWRRLRARIRRRDLTGRILVCPSNDFPTLIFFELRFDKDGISRFLVRSPRRMARLRRLIFRHRFYFG